MSKGNINYKYLKRRKSWFRRNLPLVIFIAVAVIAIAGALTAGIMLSHSNKKKQADNHDSNDEQTVVSIEETTTAREVVWIDNKEPESKEQEYIAPEGVYLPYFIKGNRAANCATVYGIDENGEYTIPVKASRNTSEKELKGRYAILYLHRKQPDCHRPPEQGYQWHVRYCLRCP
jgi:hypothetical protein